jgi:alpha-mannosidase
MNTIHLVTHTHWDREWYLTFQQFRLKLVHLLDTLFEILELDQDFKFFLLDGQTIIVEDYLEMRPERELELISFINSGRVQIGPWYISPDEYLIAPESHIRNLLEGNKLCQKYGGRMLVGYLPDSFGHIGQMPQILQGFGIQAACLWRGLDDQPCELNWSAPDGTRVLLAYLRDSYSNAASLTITDQDKFINEIHERCSSLSPYSISGHILLMNGTDHMEPSMDLTKALRAYQTQDSQYELIHSNLPLYFDDVRRSIESNSKNIPQVTGELRSSKHSALLQNTLSTRIWLKQRNHACENDLLKWVEPFSSLLTFINGLFPDSETSHDRNTQNQFLKNIQPIKRYAWKLLMQCHPHDSICGTSIDQVAEEMLVRFDTLDQINHEIISQSLQQLCDHIDTKNANSSTAYSNQQNILSTIVVFNPNDIIDNGLINLRIKLDKRYNSFEVVDSFGKLIPHQQTGLGPRELISMTLDKKGLQQALGMIHDGIVAGMVIRNIEIEQQNNRAIIHATLSDHGQIDIVQWLHGLSKVKALIEDPNVKEFIIQAISDPEIDLALVAQDVPGHGFRCYWIRGVAEESTKKPEPIKLNPFIQGLLLVLKLITRIPLFSKPRIRKKTNFGNSSNKIENEYFSVETRPSDGTLSIFDKQNRQLYSGHNRFIDSGDCGDLYNYCPPARDSIVSPMINKIQYEIGNISQKLIIDYRLMIPSSISNNRKARSHEKVELRILSTVTLVVGVPRIDIHTEIDNRAKDHRLRVHFPAPFTTSHSVQDGHYELVRRPVEIPKYDVTWEEPPRPEVPQREFTSVTNDQISLTIANSGLPEVEIFKNEQDCVEIALTLIRSVGWLSRDDISTRKGHAGPMGIETPKAQMPGNFAFDYSIIPGDKELNKSFHQAFSFNNPFRALTTSLHSGILPAKTAMIENHNLDFIITAIKLAEADTSLIVRGYNIQPTPIHVSLNPWRTFKHAYLSTLEEKQIEELPISEEGQINFLVNGNKITTIRFCD